MAAKQEASGKYFFLGLWKITLFMLGVAALVLILNVIGYQLMQFQLTWLNPFEAISIQAKLDVTQSYIGRVLVLSVIGLVHTLAAAVIAGVSCLILYAAYFGVAVIGGYETRC